MKYFSVLFCSFIGLFLVSCMSEKESSVFSSVNADECLSVLQEKAEEDGVVEVEEDEIVKEKKTVFECKGIKGYKLYTVDDGTRSWYVLKHIKRGVTSFEQEIIYKQNILGDFPNVGGSGRIEWLLDGSGAPSAFIFSVSSQLSDKETGRFETVSRYFAVKLDTVPPQMVGVAKTQKAVKELLKASQ